MKKSLKIASIIGAPSLVGSIAVGSAAWVVTTFDYNFSIDHAQRFYSVSFKQQTKEGGEKSLGIDPLEGLEVNSLLDLPLPP